jgi:Spy/CpxP family protein refolding chaperone
MKNIIFILVFMVTFLSLTQSQNKESTELLKDPKLRVNVFSAIIGEHDLMKEFLEQVKESEHARMMVTHIMGEQSSGGHENGSMMQEEHQAEVAKSPYVGEEARTIKSLSPEEVQKYRDGEGMGMAKAAELNHYPGPKHVLGVASDIKLSKEQEGKVQQVYDAMHKKAVRLGNELVDREEQLNSSFANGTTNRQKLSDELKELGRLQGQLRLTHLEAHLQVKKILTKDQIVRYDSLRGYMHSEHHQH